MSTDYLQVRATNTSAGELLEQLRDAAEFAWGPQIAAVDAITYSGWGCVEEDDLRLMYRIPLPAGMEREKARMEAKWLAGQYLHGVHGSLPGYEEDRVVYPRRSLAAITVTRFRGEEQ